MGIYFKSGCHRDGFVVVELGFFGGCGSGGGGSFSFL